MSLVVYVVALLALVPVMNMALNLFVLRKPGLPAHTSKVAILIPARNEEAMIASCVDAACASTGVPVEVVVLDDGSTDATAAIVRERAASDPRIRLVQAPSLPPGWKGKTHACHVLSQLTDAPFLLFVDADVRLAPDGAARLLPEEGIDLVSGVPCQEVEGFMETAVIPMINFLLLGYLPVRMMRAQPTKPSLAAACGQLIMVRASAYRSSGGHAAIPATLHDGLMLARHFRRSGFSTGLVNATELASCRMYNGARQVWNGFIKNATEGMARPLALPVWTVLLGGGVLLPPLLLVTSLFTQSVPHTGLLAVICLMLFCARIAQAIACRESWKSVACFPAGVALTLAIQWTALVSSLRGRTVEWRGRVYAPPR